MEREKKCLAEFLEDYDDEKDDHRFYRVTSHMTTSIPLYCRLAVVGCSFIVCSKA